MTTKKPKLGSGGRFKALVNKIGKKVGKARATKIAAVIGMRKYGKKRMSKMAAAGRKRKARKK